MNLSPSSSFKDLSLHPQILATLDKLGFTEPTDIQNKAIPILLGTEKTDFLGQAQTGTGKTLAFGIPLIQNIEVNQKGVQALIVAPTRELVVQTAQSLRQVAAPLGITVEAIYGGASMHEQMHALKRGIHIVVGTPGRLNDHISRRTLALNNLKTLVLDEADIMLDMGFKDEVDSILEATPHDRQIWLFSATIKPGIASIMREHMKDTVKVNIGGQNITTTNTKQYYAIAPTRDRFNALCRFIDVNPSFYGFIFCQTKMLTAQIAEKLMQHGYPANALHGDMNQSQRNIIIKKFKNKEFTILVATDVAARGIDIANLTHVINYSLPHDHEGYIHRIGRTGRAGKDGIAISFIGHKGEMRTISMFEKKFKIQISPMAIPGFADIKKVYVEKAKEYLASLAQTPQTADNNILQEIISPYSQEQLAHMMTQIVGKKFFKGLQSADIATSAFAESDERDNNSQEIIVHLGTDDGLTPENMVEAITEFMGIKKEALEKLKMIKRRTFIKLPSDLAGSALEILAGKLVRGKRIRVTLAQDEQEEGGRRSFGRRGPRQRSDRSFSRGRGRF